MDANQLATVTSYHIQGMPQGEIAQRVGVTRETVCRNLNKPEVRAKIEAEAAQIINRGLSQARRTIVRLAAMGNVKGQDKDTLKLALDASKHITSIAGLSGNNSSTIVNALIQVNNNGVETSEVRAIHDFLANQWAGLTTNQQIVNNRLTGVEASHTPPRRPTGEVIDAETIPPGEITKVEGSPESTMEFSTHNAGSCHESQALKETIPASTAIMDTYDV